MVTFEEIVAAGTALVRSIGHQNTCPKASQMIPCTCGAGKQQAKALDDWQHLMADVQKTQQTSTALGFMLDWSELQRGEISFKTFADKWLPYVKEVDTKSGL
jgi:hypothetical protein